MQKGWFAGFWKVAKDTLFYKCLNFIVHLFGVRKKMIVFSQPLKRRVRTY